jgi:hypothetical protein
VRPGHSQVGVPTPLRKPYKYINIFDGYTEDDIISFIKIHFNLYNRNDLGARGSVVG